MAIQDDPAHVGISIIMPAYREREGIARSASEAAAWLQSKNWPHEVLVIDDGSDDGTASEAAAAALTHSGIRVIRHERNRGYGAALRTGIAASRHGLVLMMDADGQCMVQDLEAMLPKLDMHDAVIGVRAERADPPLRKAMSGAYNTLLCLVFGLPNRDANCPLKLWRRTDLLRLPLRCDRFFAPAEMLMLASEAGLTVTEQPVRHRPRSSGRSSVSAREIGLMFGELLRHLVSPVRGTMVAPTKETFECWNERHSRQCDHDAYFNSENLAIRLVGQGRMSGIVKALDVQSGDRVLDIGCGDGTMLATLPDCDKTGIDMSGAALEQSRARLGGKATILKMNMEAMTFADASFDKISCSEVLEHVLHPDRALAEIARVLKPGGTAAVSIPNEGAIKFAKKWCTRLGGGRMLSMGKGRTLMPIQNPWHLHDASLKLLKSWLPPELKIVGVKRIPFAPLPLHYVVTLRHR